MRDEDPQPYLTLDGGALLFENEKLATSQREQALVTAAGIAAAYNLMGYDAVGVARQDLAGGLDFLKDLQKGAEFSWLSANLVNRTSRKPIFAPSLVRQVGGLTVGIIGLTGSEPAAPLPFFTAADAAEIMPWQEVLPGLVAELSKKCDMIILLSSYPLAVNQQIAQTLAGVHLIIQAGTDVNNRAPEQHNNTLIGQTAKQGKYLGVLQITWQDSKTWGDDTLKNLLAGKVNELDGLSWRLFRLRDRRPPEELAGDETYRDLQSREAQLLAEIRELDEAVKQQSRAAQNPATYANRFLAMEVDLPDQPDVLAIVEQTKNKVNELGKKTATSMKAGTTTAAGAYPPDFIGWRACAACHRPQAEFWRKTAHAGAYETLVKGQQNFNLNCLPCHVTYDGSSPANAAATTAALLTLPVDLQQVGCEACHGPGQSHKARPAKTNITKRPPAEVCGRCHTPDRDDNFDYEADLKLINCPAG